MLTINEIPNTEENARLINKDLQDTTEGCDDFGLARGCIFAYTMTGHEGYIIRAQCYLQRAGIADDRIDDELFRIGLKLAGDIATKEAA